MDRLSTETSLQQCMELCWQCRHECQTTLFGHCLTQGGRHLAPEHVKLMQDCIDICQVAADFMARGSAQHSVTCGACAEVCAACARSCREVGGDVMNRCAELCERCARSCEQMAA
jgi:hypothetical protein